MIEKIFIISFLVFAIWYSMKPGEILGLLGDWLERQLPAKLHKPIFDCPVCMAGGYGAIIYWLIWASTIREWLIVNIAAIGLNAILTNLFRPRDE